MSRQRKTAAARPRGKARKVSPVNAKRGAAPSQSKQDLVIQMLRRQSGVSIDDIIAKTGWQSHSVRGFFSGLVRKKLKLPLVSDVGKDSNLGMQRNLPSKSEIFLWTSLANEACVWWRRTDRLTSEHALAPGLVNARARFRALARSVLSSPDSVAEARDNKRNSAPKQVLRGPEEDRATPVLTWSALGGGFTAQIPKNQSRSSPARDRLSAPGT